MVEDLKSKLAAINAAKADRLKKNAESKLNAEMDEAHIEANAENALRDKATALEAKVGDAEQGRKEAEDAIQQAEGMLAEGGLEAEEQAAVEGIKEESKQKIGDLRGAEEDLARAQNEIFDLNKPKEQVEKPVENTAETVASNLVSETENQGEKMAADGGGKEVNETKHEKSFNEQMNDLLKSGKIYELKLLLEKDDDKRKEYQGGKVEFDPASVQECLNNLIKKADIREVIRLRQIIDLYSKNFTGVDVIRAAPAAEIQEAYATLVKKGDNFMVRRLRDETDIKPEVDPAIVQEQYADLIKQTVMALNTMQNILTLNKETGINPAVDSAAAEKFIGALKKDSMVTARDIEEINKVLGNPKG